MHISKTRKHDISCTFPVLPETSHFMYISKQEHMKFPVHFLWYQIFHMTWIFPWSRTHDIYCTYPEILHFMYIYTTKTRDISCDTRNFRCCTCFHCQGLSCFPMFLFTPESSYRKCEGNLMCPGSENVPEILPYTVPGNVKEMSMP